MTAPSPLALSTAAYYWKPMAALFRALERLSTPGMYILLDHNPAAIPHIFQCFSDCRKIQVAFT